jgi:hypothetical protein
MRKAPRQHKNLPVAPVADQDGRYVEEANAPRAGGALVLALQNASGLTRQELARLLPPPKTGRPVTGPAVTSWIHGRRQLTVNRLTEVAAATGHRLELVAVPIEKPDIPSTDVD